MDFHFSLESVLHLRRLLEEQAEHRLEQSLMRLRALERRRDEAARWSEHTARTLAAKKKLPAIELQFIHRVLRQTREAISECRLQIELEQQRTGELRAAYLQARTARRMLSALREQAWMRHQAEEQRMEQNELDEIFLSKRERERGAAASHNGLTGI